MAKELLLFDVDFFKKHPEKVKEIIEKKFKEMDEEEINNKEKEINKETIIKKEII